MREGEGRVHKVTVVMGGHNYVVTTGNTSNTITINPSTIAIVAPSGTVTLTSPDAYLLPNTDGTVVAPQTCNPTNFNNMITFTGTGSTFTITPTIQACYTQGGGGGQLNMTTKATAASLVVGNSSPSSSSTKNSNNTSSTSTVPATITMTVTPVVTATAAPVVVGCTNGALFSTTNGQACTGMSTVSPAVPMKPVSSYSFTTTISKTSAKAEIMNVQAALNSALGTSLKTQLKVDGKFGPATTAAIKLFQKMNKISTTGVVGVKTGAALNALDIPMSH